MYVSIGIEGQHRPHTGSKYARNGSKNRASSPTRTENSRESDHLTSFPAEVGVDGDEFDGAIRS